MRSSFNDILRYLHSPDTLFVKGRSNIKPGENFITSNMPGKTKDFSGSCIGGYSIGINKNINEEKKKYASMILEYILSSEFQKKINMDFGYQSALKEYFDDDTLCQEYPQCQDIKNIQSVLRPINITNDYRKYSSKFRNNLSKYLYKDENLDECLTNINHITKIFYHDNSTMLNKSILSIITVTDIFILITYCLAFTKKHRNRFRFLNRFYWFLYLFGLICIMAYGHTSIGKITVIKCKLRPVVFSLGFTLSTTLLLIRMIVNFPFSNRIFVKFCENHFGLALLIALCIDMIFIIGLFVDSYEIEVAIDDDVMYNTCKMKSFNGHLFLGLIFLYKIYIFLSLFIIVFIEWNIKEFSHDVHYATGVLFISLIIYIIYAVVTLIGIHGINEEFIIPTLITYFYGFSNYAIYFFSRFFIKMDEDEEVVTLKNAKYSAGSKKTISRKYSSNASINQTSSNGSAGRKMSMADRLISLHTYGDEIKKSSDLYKSSNHSSTTNISGSQPNMRKYSRSTNNINTIEEYPSLNRRTSQITSIPENQVAIYSSTTDKISETGSGQSRGRTRSFENFIPGFNRIKRINSTPNKIHTNSGQQTQTSSQISRKGSNVSFSNVQPINAVSSVNLSSRISSNNSINQSNENISRISQKIGSISTISSDKLNATSTAKSSEYVSVEIPEEKSETSSNNK